MCELIIYVRIFVIVIAARLSFDSIMAMIAASHMKHEIDIFVGVGGKEFGNFGSHVAV